MEHKGIRIKSQNVNVAELKDIIYFQRHSLAIKEPAARRISTIELES
jgi:hypothetical protein